MNSFSLGTSLNGAFLVHKHSEISSFGIIESLQNLWLKQNPGLKRKDLPKLGHGGTLDPFATGLLVVLVGKGVKLAQYFLGSNKTYTGVILFGKSTPSGDLTTPISETSEKIPTSLEQMQTLAHQWIKNPYLQTPPMYSAKKQKGTPLYKLAREGIEVERAAQLCHLFQFDLHDYEPPQVQFHIECSSGTYIRTAAEDFARLMGSIAVVEKLNRVASGAFQSHPSPAFPFRHSMTLEEISKATTTSDSTSETKKQWDELPCWIPFNELLTSYPRAEVSPEETLALSQGKQQTLLPIIDRLKEHFFPQNILTLYCQNELVAIAKKTDHQWKIERVFNSD